MLLIKVRMRGAVPKVLKRRMPEFNRAGFEEMGQQWHKRFRLKHFTHAGAREYGYQKRQGENLSRNSKGWRASYTGRKYRKFGHTLPLVYTGESRWRTSFPNIKAFKDRVRVTMSVPGLNRRNALHRRGRGRAIGTARSEIRKADELRTVSDRERRSLAFFFNERRRKAIYALTNRSA